MIRINLLASERKQAKKKSVSTLATGQKMVLACGALMILSASLVVWRYFALNRQSAQLDADISAAQQETTRLHSIILQVQQFEQRKAQLQQRVVLIEQLRKGQVGPVHMLDQISRSLPPMLWLTELKQQPDGSVVVDGRCTSMTSLSDFIANLEASGYFKRSIEIVSTQTEPMNTPPGEMVRFSIKAIFQQPGQPAEPAKPAQKTGG